MGEAPSRKRSIYLGDAGAKLLELEGPENCSATIETAISRYLAVMEASLPAFSKSEWCAICDTLNGTMFDDTTWIRHTGPLLAQELHDAGPDGIYEKWDIDGPALCQKLNALTTPQALAILHVVTVFWGRTDLSNDEAFALAGLNFPKAPQDEGPADTARRDAILAQAEPPLPLATMSEDEKDTLFGLYLAGVAKGRARMKSEAAE